MDAVIVTLYLPGHDDQQVGSYLSSAGTVPLKGDHVWHPESRDSDGAFRTWLVVGRLHRPGRVDVPNGSIDIVVVPSVDPLDADITPIARDKKAKLNEVEVLQIRTRVADGETQAALAREFGVSQGQISEITTGRAWRHVGGPITRGQPNRQSTRRGGQ